MSGPQRRRAVVLGLVLALAGLFVIDLVMATVPAGESARGRVRLAGAALLVAGAVGGWLFVRRAQAVRSLPGEPDEDLLLRLQAWSLAAEFTPSLAHDGNNALLSMRFQLAELARLHAGDAATEALVEGVDRDVGVLERLIRRMRELGLDRDAERVRSLDLAAVVREVEAGMKTHVRSRACELRLEVADEILMAADRRRMEQAVVSLVLHAVARSSDGGNVLLRARVDGGRVTVEVHDDGMLPRPEDLEAGREAFHTSADDRSGLLLWACRVCARRHGGSLQLERSELGGLCRRMVLPRDLDMGERGAAARPAERASTPVESA